MELSWLSDRCGIVAVWARDAPSIEYCLPLIVEVYQGLLFSAAVHRQAKAKVQVGIKIAYPLTDAGIFTYLLKIFPGMCRNHGPG